MGLNLGTPAVNAAKALKDSPEWAAFRAGLRELVRKLMNEALDAADPHVGQRQIGYTAALRDLDTALESATSSIPINTVAKTGPIGKKE